MFDALIESIREDRSFRNIQSNVIAGITVGVIALPLSMALAIAIDVDPQYGLYTAIVAGIVIALTGGSRVNISGPTAAFVVVLLPVVHQFGVGGLLVAGMMAGVILVLMGVARLGGLIEIVPYPVVIGFTAGIGVVIATLQIKDFLGLSGISTSGSYFTKVQNIVTALPSIHWQEALIGGVTLAVLILWPRLKSRIPGHLVALFIGSLLAWLLSAGAHLSVETIASRFHYMVDGLSGQGIPPVMPQFNWPWNLPGKDGQTLSVSFGLFRELMPVALTIALLGALESLLCSVVADGMTGRKHNPNAELIGQGVGNIVAPFFGGIPATAAIARTAANIRAGGTSPLSAVIHGLFILISILFLAPLLGYIPMASMAALLLVVAWNMSEAHHFVRIIRIAPRNDILILLTCFLLTVLFDMTVAVAVGMGLAAALFIRRNMQLAEGRLMAESRVEGHTLKAGIAIYDINGPLFFGTARLALKNLTLADPQIHVVILDMAEVTMMDVSAMLSLESIVADLRRKNVALVISGLQPRMILKLRRVGVRYRVGMIQFARHLDEALTLAEHLCERGSGDKDQDTSKSPNEKGS
ncbi:MAG: C4-dicarboxylic acid transporter DauA [Halothiobacillus sp. 14-56-357]|jgi:SulP family sulfate permease|uniref:C4-dicarboxylic acid transporter DauA n=1 Tax=Halothiobacillus sp. 15-55-196 TaxID=1970382 RepID=UPI000BDB3CD8|nr:C4-dicarboxylic acid transporter DauA [Halothiobacillus sp. 15-55-196]OZB37063.1 MAG: C4-dicarboxylic acid transporter DauA [Halothiobacillus sp. 15-55-196]OZB56921.1 MAG: C4-dicarboxylic acid transporter DauA [Halothiobacillus sp. 14-56-357]OZB79111.1 MAG: C4-dicarboxylic acid transporter DauA [Halothiobacillus sp. 13-55-115]